MQVVPKMNIKIRYLLLAILLTLIFGFLAVLTWHDLEQFQLWLSIDIVVHSTFPKFSLLKIIHLTIALPLLFYGFYHVGQIIQLNRSAHTSRNNPNSLLQEGYYGKTRHPMYTMFLFISSGFTFAMCNYLATIISVGILLLFYILAIVEEKYMLGPIFGDEYLNYKNNVRRRFFTNLHWIIQITLFVVSLIGAFF